MATSSNNLTLPSDVEIAMTRVFDAPRERVFKAMTDAEAIPQWWGQRASTTIVDKMDVRVGGVWRYIEREQDGTEYAFNGVYKEIVPPERLVYTFEFEPMAGHIMTDHVTLETVEGKTRVTVTSRFDSIEDRDGMLNSGMEGGATESWDRLAELLEKMD